MNLLVATGISLILGASGLLWLNRGNGTLNKDFSSKIKPMQINIRMIQIRNALILPEAEQFWQNQVHANEHQDNAAHNALPQAASSSSTVL